jgi:predicted NAD-dependent protein-ADP-ribosyltransferase YbiA (DUF1768 family)
MATIKDGMHPRYLGFQRAEPVFVKIPFVSDGKNWKKSEHFNWAERDIEEQDAASLYATGHIYHNTELAKVNKVGDRLGEMNKEQLYSLVVQLNGIVKEKTTTTKEFNDKRCKQSKIEDKQRGLIRRFLNRNPWIVDDFYQLRDHILGNT